MKRMEGKVVLITGGSSGYGKATAKRLVEEGAVVIIAARNLQMLEAAREETGCAYAIPMDVTAYEDWKRVYDVIVEQYGRLDVLINNAGGGVAIKDVTEQTPEEIDQSVALNLNSVIYGTNTFAGL